MNVLIACEFSGITRDAFRVLGHDAISCDLLMRDDDLFHPSHAPKCMPPPEPIYVATRIASGKEKNRYAMDSAMRRWHWTESQSSSRKDRAHERSRTFQSIATAMALQWGGNSLITESVAA